MRERSASDIRDLLGLAKAKAYEGSELWKEMEEAAQGIEDITNVQYSEMLKMLELYRQAAYKRKIKAEEVDRKISEMKKDLGSYMKAAEVAGQRVSLDFLNLYTNVKHNEGVVNKNYSYTSKTASSQADQLFFRKDVIRQEESKHLKTLPEKIKFAFKGTVEDFQEALFADNKKSRKRLVDDLVDGLGKKGSIGGILGDLFKLGTILVASYAARFGMAGKIIGALTIMSGGISSLVGIFKAIQWLKNPALFWNSIPGKLLKGLGVTGKALGTVGKVALKGAPLIGAAFSGFEAFQSFKEGETGKGIAFLVSAISAGLAPFLGPFAPIAIAISLISGFIGTFWDKLKDWWKSIKEGFFAGLKGEKVDEDASIPAKVANTVAHGSNQVLAGALGVKPSKDVSFKDKVLNSLGSSLIPPHLKLAGLGIAGVAGVATQINRSIEAYSSGVGLPEGSPLKLDAYGRVTNFSKLKRNDAWDAMMEWRKRNPQEFDKRYEIIDANAVYTDPEGKKHKGSDLIDFGSFITDLSNRRGNEIPTQIIMGKGFLDKYMRDMLEYKKWRGGRDPYRYQKITSGIGTAEGTHTKGNKWYQHDNPYGYTYDISGGGADDYVRFLNEKYPKSKSKTFMHGSGTGIGGWHGHISTNPKEIEAAYSSDLLIKTQKTIQETPKGTNTDKELKEQPYTLMEDLNKQLGESLPPVPKISDAGYDFTGSETSNKILMGIGNVVNVGADASYMIG